MSWHGLYGYSMLPKPWPRLSSLPFDSFRRYSVGLAMILCRELSVGGSDRSVLAAVTWGSSSPPYSYSSSERNNNLKLTTLPFLDSSLSASIVAAC